jgi:hypothetical protein
MEADVDTTSTTTSTTMKMNAARDRARSMTPMDEAKIAYYFHAQSLFDRSTFGPMIERAVNIGHDSARRRLKAPVDNWNWTPPARDELTGRLADHGDDQQMQLHELNAGGGYEVEHDQLVRFADASRRMLAVERLSPKAKVVLEAYYGDRGSRWAVYGADRVDPETGKEISGAGPGSIAALFILTVEGQAFVSAERLRDRDLHGKNAKVARRTAAIAIKRADLELEIARASTTLDETTRAHGSSERREALQLRIASLQADVDALGEKLTITTKSPSRELAHLTDDEVLANAFALQKAQPSQDRAARLMKVRDVAEGLLVAAWSVWMKTAPPRRAIARAA